MTRAYHANSLEFGDPALPPAVTEDKEALKARAAIQRERLIETERRATSCAPTMRTIRLCDNSAYDSNCPAVWKHAHDMGCVIR